MIHCPLPGGVHAAARPTPRYSPPPRPSPSERPRVLRRQTHVGVVLGFGGGRAPRRRHRGGAVGPAVLLQRPRFVQTVLRWGVGGASPGRGRVLEPERESERERERGSEVTKDTNTTTEPTD